jgi:hypothetical protein
MGAVLLLCVAAPVLGAVLMGLGVGERGPGKSDGIGANYNDGKGKLGPFSGAVAISILVSGPVGDAKADFFPQIIYDSREGPGQNIYTTQGLHYTAGVGWAISAKAISITFDGVNFIPLVDGTVDLHAAFIDSSVSDGVVTGHFTGVGGPMPDLIVADATGILLGTNYYNRRIRGVFGATEGTTDSGFLVVSGSLAPFYSQTQGNGSNDGFLFDIAPSFSANTFAGDFDGHIAGVISPVPEPSTTMLLGIGILGVVGYARRRSRPA